MRKLSYQRISSLFVIAIFAFLIVQNPMSNHYMEKLKSDAVLVSATKDLLYTEIQEKILSCNIL